MTKVRVPTGYIGREPKSEVRKWRNRLIKRAAQRTRDEEIERGLAEKGDEQARANVLAKEWRWSRAHRAAFKKPTKVLLKCLEKKDVT